MKLCYFNCRGLAETSRLLLALAGTDYEDFRYPLEIIDWKTHNFKKEEFDADKEGGKLVKSLNKVPYLIDDDRVLSQSKSIERYLAKKYGFMGDNLWEESLIDSICEWIRDFKQAYQSIRKLPEDEKDKGMEKWFSIDLVEKNKSLEKILGKTYSVGNKISLADITIFSFITQFFDRVNDSKKSIDNCPHLKSIVDNISGQSEIINWLVKRPETNF